MADIVVVGAGISGLASAWFLKRRGHVVRVLEFAAAPGGCLQTRHEQGFLIEAGPNSTLLRNGALGALVHELDLDAELLEANALARRRYIVKGDRLLCLPGDPWAFVRTPLFSAGAKWRLMIEPLWRRARAEESVAQFVRRRLGPEFLDWAVDPFVSGVYAGDPERLSVRAATAKIYDLEARYGSLLLGAVARLLGGRASGPTPVGRLISFRAGMQALPDAIAQRLGGALACGSEVTAVVRVGQRWRVRTGAAEYGADHVVLAVPAYRAAPLLAPLDPVLAQELAAIRYAPVASVALGFGRTQVAHALDGFGMLIPRRAGRVILGSLFSSSLFPGRAPGDAVLLTTFLGGARQPSVGTQDRATLAGRALADLRPLLGVTGAPRLERTTLWPQAIPQYELGHLDRLRRIDARATALPGLHLRANWRDGIAVGDCVESARRLAESL